MSDFSLMKRNRERWVFVTRLLMVGGLLRLLYSATLYYSLFWTEAKVRASRELILVGISCWIAALIVVARLGLFKWRR